MTTQNRFLKMCDKKSSPPDTCQAVLFRAHKPRQTGCVGFLGRSWVRLPQIFLRDTGRNRTRQVFSMLIASTISLTAKEKPRRNASRSPRFINSV